MAKYIDADRLRAAIEEKYRTEIWPWLSGVSPKSVIYEYVLPLIDSLKQEQQEKPIPKDLEEAARKYKEGVPVDTIIYYCGTDEDVYFSNRIVDAFIAGAKWQAEQDKETIELAEDHAYLAGSVNEREKMMKEAVEGDVNIYRDLTAGKSWAEFVVEMPTNNLGDKVRVIVLKKED